MAILSVNGEPHEGDVQAAVMQTVTGEGAFRTVTGSPIVGPITLPGKVVLLAPPNGFQYELVPTEAPVPEPPAEALYRFTDSLAFDGLASRWDQVRGPGEGGTVSAPPAGMPGTQFRANGNIGKALVAKMADRVYGPGSRFRAVFDLFVIGSGVPRQCYLVDFEADRDAGGGESELGIRLRIGDDGRLEVERDKMADLPTIRCNPGLGAIRLAGALNTIEFEVLLSLQDSGADAGEMIVWLDGVEVLRATGRTLPVRGYKGWTAAGYNRLQIGLTANGGASVRTIVAANLLWDIR